MICRNHQTTDSRGVIPTFHQCKPSTSLWDGQSVILITIPTFQHSEELTGKLAVSWSYLYVQERRRRRRSANPERAGADVQHGRPRADRCVDACSQDQAGVLCQGGGDGEKDREGEREDEWREGRRKGGREEQERGRGWFLRPFQMRQLEKNFPRSGAIQKQLERGGKKFGDERLGLYRHWRAPILCHLVKIGSSGYNKSVSLPLAYPFGGLHAAFFAWWKHSPPFHPPYFCFFWNKKLFQWPITSTTHTHVQHFQILIKLVYLYWVTGMEEHWMCKWRNPEWRRRSWLEFS